MGSVIEHLCLLTGLTQRKSRDNLQLGARCPEECLTSQKLEDRRRGGGGVEKRKLTSMIITFQRGSSQGLEKEIHIVKLARGFLNEFHLKKAEKEFTVIHFSKKKCSKKKEIRAQSQEEAH